MYKWDNHMHNNQVNEQKWNVSRERRIFNSCFYATLWHRNIKVHGHLGTAVYAVKSIVKIRRDASVTTHSVDVYHFNLSKTNKGGHSYSNTI